MLLIFQLGRPDVPPVDDFGVRNGFRIAYKKAVMPTPVRTIWECCAVSGTAAAA